MDNIQITSLGVKRSLSKFTEIEAIIEYIWNGFDAKASKVFINTTFNELGGVNSLTVRDNGTGIEREKLEDKFKPFFQSEKLVQGLQEKKRKNSTFHGKNGVGRLTFFKFSDKATWETVYKEEDGKNKKYSIFISSKDLTKYTPSDVTETLDDCGTVVKFDDIIAPISLYDLEKELKIEFCWYLMLNKNRNFEIFINDIPLSVNEVITQSDKGVISIGTHTFEWEFINWNISLKKEYSRYYFINSNFKESFKEYTTFNNKGDKFYHSIFVKSSFFDEFMFDKNSIHSSQLNLFQDQNETYKTLIKKLDLIISDRRTPYIRKYSKKIIEDLEQINAFDNYEKDNFIDQYKKETIQEFIQELYIIEPKIFTQLNKEQKLTMVRLLDAFMNSADKNNLFKILESVLDLDSEDKEKLAKLLEVTPLNNLTKTINFLMDRLKALNYFEQMVYKENLKANEVDDLQYMLEQNYWLFGEQYSAVAKAEDSFVKLVKKHFDVLRKEDGEENEKALKTINMHPDKLKQVDICCVRQMPTINTIENIVVEIKHPLKVITQEHYQQVRKYLEILTSVKEFVADNYKWTFYLIGTSISKSVKDDLENSKVKGRTGLIFEKDNFKIEVYVRTWASIFNEYKIKYNNIYERLKIEESSLISNESSIQMIKDKQSKLDVE